MALVAILYGGRSGEHDVSRTSAASVLSHLAMSHEVLLVGITQEGTWYLQEKPDPVPKILEIFPNKVQRLLVCPGEGITDSTGRILDIELVFPILHGSFGEDGSIQGLLESARVPYVGAGILSSALCMDKDMTKQICFHSGLPVVPWKTLRKKETISADLWDKLADKMGRQLFIKPTSTGSSLGVSRVSNKNDFFYALDKAWQYDEKILVEKAIDAREIECSVMGDSFPQVYPPGEVIPTGSHTFYDYDAKYMDPKGAKLQVPALLDKSTLKQIKEMASKAYKAVEASGLARVDFLLEKESNLFINEINTMPGMTPTSLFPRMLAAGGVDFTTMLDKLITDALIQHQSREERSYTR